MLRRNSVLLTSLQPSLGLMSAALLDQRLRALDPVTFNHKPVLPPIIRKQQHSMTASVVIRPPSPTLAQRLAVVPGPEPAVTQKQWTAIEQTAAVRGAADEGCAVCLQPFSCTQTVVLSCTHVFHRSCLAAVEKAAGQRICPICRHAQYQAKITHLHDAAYLNRMATVIQSAWRGHRVR